MTSATHYCPNCREPVTAEPTGWLCDACGWTDQDEAIEALEETKSENELHHEAEEYAADIRLGTEKDYR